MGATLCRSLAARIEAYFHDIKRHEQPAGNGDREMSGNGERPHMDKRLGFFKF